jgi:hypothetical protein
LPRSNPWLTLEALKLEGVCSSCREKDFGNEETGMKNGGLRELLKFLNYLDKSKIGYNIEHDRPDSIMVTFTLIGKRIELDFFEDHIEYSVFTGDESVEDDVEKLMGMIKDFVAE